MPAGCEFTCKNEECKYCDSGFIIVGPWGIGRIELVIEDLKVKENESFRKELIERKNNGMKYASITYPNVSEIPVEGYRVQKWCQKCACIWNYDAMKANPSQPIEEVLAMANIPEKCVKCGEKLQDFKEIIDEGIECPHCHEKMKQNRWFSNES